MNLAITSTYLEPGTHFEVSYKVNVLIKEMVKTQLLEKIQIQYEQEDSWLFLDITTESEACCLEVKGPFLSKKGKEAEWRIFLPYKKVANASNVLFAYLHYVFEAVVKVLSHYGVKEQDIRSVQKMVVAEVMGNPSYEPDDEELFAFAENKIDFDHLVLGSEDKEESNILQLPTLIRQMGEEIRFWEIWQDDEDLLEHWGTVGEEGEFLQKNTREAPDVEKTMARQYEEKISEGYREVERRDETELVVQFHYDDSNMQKSLLKRHVVETLLNEWLGSIGNGYCREGDVGSGTSNAFCQVLDLDKALAIILIGLTSEGLLKNIKIAYFNEELEEYKLLYPKSKESFNL